MKFFTPERFVRLQSDDDDVADAAHEEWEAAADAYREHFERARRVLPGAAARLLDQSVLHDALLLGAGAEGERFVLVLGPEGPDRGSIVLTYELISPPTLVDAGLSEAFRSDRETLLYDEFDVNGEGSFEHRLLLADGRELRLHFRDLTLLRCPPLDWNSPDFAACAASNVPGAVA